MREWLPKTYYAAAGGGGAGPTPTPGATPGGTNPEVHIRFTPDGQFSDVQGDPDAIAHLMRRIDERRRQNRLRNLLGFRQRNPNPQPPNPQQTPPQHNQQPTPTTQPRQRSRLLAAGAGFLGGAVVVGAIWTGTSLARGARFHPSPVILAAGQCKTLPAGSIAVGYDYSLDGTTGYHDNNTAAVIELFKPGKFCAGTIAGKYQEFGTTDQGDMNTLAANYKTQEQQTGCAGGVGCSYITTIVVK